MTSYVSPVRGLRVTSLFGPRDDKFHPGIDVTSSDPTGPVVSMTNGTVVAEWTYQPTFVKRTGNTVVTQNVLVVGDDGVAVLYSGLPNKTKYDKPLVGTRVTTGTQPIVRFDLDRMDDNDNRLFGVTAQIAWTPKPSYQLTVRTPALRDQELERHQTI